MRTYLTATIEAPDLETAKEIARDLDGAAFVEDEHGLEWETFDYDVQLVPEGGGG